ncbi:hypothetical protein VSR69_15380 [Paraburkholderia phytofirmans]|jgi:hypothetical protein|uniref:Uncharacterized protein n=1 Tax=Paraburkholderia dipogonis TaxID=1211383 RepID=A0ABW9AP57_9BURK|nr:hypothetical protein [Paraburkholderia sp. BL9I2N2]
MPNEDRNGHTYRTAIGAPVQIERGIDPAERKSADRARETATTGGNRFSDRRRIEHTSCTFAQSG